MELWIRSQDKTALAQVDNLSCIENRIVFIPNNLGGSATVGKYKTKNRALEVMNEIETLILYAGSRPDEFRNIKDKLSNWATSSATGVAIYEMPEE